MSATYRLVIHRLLLRPQINKQLIHTRDVIIPARIRRVEASLLRSRDLLARGMSERRLGSEVRAGRLIRVTRGWFVEAATWNAWFPKDRHLAAVLAAHCMADTPPLFSHHSAAVLLGLPVWNLSGERVHTVSTSTSTSSATVKRHLLEVDPADTGTVAGISCTNHTRTVFDLAGIASMETILGCADAVLARHARKGRTVSESDWNAWRTTMFKHIEAAGHRSRGLQATRRVIELADPRAESVLESVSRLQLLRLGYELDLQVPVASPHGGFLYMDFELLGLRVYGECDGDFKYLDPELRAGRSADEVVVREKKRDNWVSGSTKYQMVHWGARDAVTPERLARVLQGYHVPLPRLH